jgi:hypothetical protein
LYLSLDDIFYRLVQRTAKTHWLEIVADQVSFLAESPLAPEVVLATRVNQAAERPLLADLNHQARAEWETAHPKTADG